MLDSVHSTQLVIPYSCERVVNISPDYEMWANTDPGWKVLQLWASITAIAFCSCGSLETGCRFGCWLSISGRSKMKPRNSDLFKLKAWLGECQAC